jgi:hypothetical protein
VVRPIVVDNGALRIVPAPPAQPARLSFQSAYKTVKAAQTYDQGTFIAADVGYGDVSLSTALTKKLPDYQSRYAWVAFLGPQKAFSCAAYGGGVLQPAFHVIIVDARTGKAVLDYRSRGTGPCGGKVTGPVVQRAEEILSLRWRALADQPVTAAQAHQLNAPGGTFAPNSVNWVISYTIPRCGKAADNGLYYLSGLGEPPTLYVDAQVPIDPSRSCARSRVVTTTFGPERTPASTARHAPTGLATGPAL